jgi:uncharacterized protein YbjT (DUF2867 family)
MIALLGGTGFVGSYLLERIIEAREYARCSVRTAIQRELVARLGLEPVCADIRDRKSLVALCDGARVVINLVTATRETRSCPFRAVHGEGMRNVIWAARQTGIERIVHVGALGPDRAVDERRYPYLYWKRMARSLLEESGMPYIILETSIVYGPGDQHLSHVALALKWMPFFPLAGGKVALSTRFQPLWVGDLVQALLAATQPQVDASGTLPLGGPAVWTFGEMLGLVQQILDSRRRVVSIPRWLMKAYFGNGQLSPVSSSMLDLLRDGIDSIADSTATYRCLGLKPDRLEDRCSYLREVGMRDLLAWRKRTPIYGAFSHLTAPEVNR